MAMGATCASLTALVVSSAAVGTAVAAAAAAAAVSDTALRAAEGRLLSVMSARAGWLDASEPATDAASATDPPGIKEREVSLKGDMNGEREKEVGNAAHPPKTSVTLLHSGHSSVPRPLCSL